jgi:hypothetical protein
MNDKELSGVLRTLKADHDPKLIELLSPHWEYSRQNEPRDWQLLQRAHWQDDREWCGCAPEVDGALQEVAAQIVANPALHSLAWHCCRLIFEIDDYNRFGEWTALIPLLEEIRPAIRSAFFLLLALDAVPRLRERNQRRGVSEKITRGTLGDIAIATRRFARYNDNAIGIEPRLLAWHRLVSSGELYRVGRFEYHVRPFQACVRVYRHRVSQRVLALSAPDIDYNSTGHRLLHDPQGEFALQNQTPSWKSTFHETATTIRAHPVSPRGFAQKQPIEIQTNEWELVFASGDKVLVVHIPEGESVTLENSRASFEQAHQFFTQQQREYSLRAFATNSWMLNTQFETMLPPSSKMLAWQRELYLFPAVSTGKDGLYFVFNRDEIDLATAPRDTTLRRAMIDHLLAGNPLRNGGMFFLFDDFPRYGTQVYRKMQDG